MELSALKAFAAVASLGSLTRASMTLGADPAAVSRKISALERECGGRLFFRTGRGMTLTELGERVQPRVRDVLSSLEQLANEVRTQGKAADGEVRLGLLPSLSEPLVNTLFKELHRKHPGIRLRVSRGSRIRLDQKLEAGEIDIAVLLRRRKLEAGKEVSLGVAHTYLVGPANDRLTRSPTVPFSRLRKIPLVLSSPTNDLRAILDNVAAGKGMSLSVMMEVNSLSVQKDLVIEGSMHTILSGYAVAREVREGHLRASRVVEPDIRRTITLSFASHKSPTPACKVVARAIRGIFNDASEVRHMQSPARP
jgi:DNA-binding transcriptional LysR family regulator